MKAENLMSHPFLEDPIDKEKVDTFGVH